MERVDRITRFLNSIEGLLTVGKHGVFGVGSVSESVLAGLEAAERVSEAQHLRPEVG